MTRNRRRLLLGGSIAVSLLTVVVGVTELVYYFPLTPLSLDTRGKTRLPSTSQLRLLFVGDILLADAARGVIGRRGHDYIFGATRGLIQQADLAVGNLEGPISPKGSKAAKRWSYRMEAAAARALAGAGFDLMCLANNHIRDCGDVGIRETIELLAREKVGSFGAGLSEAQARRPALASVRGVRVALLGYVPPRIRSDGREISYQHLAAAARRGGAALALPDRIAQDVRRAREGADLVIVSIHLGGRYQREPSSSEKRLCRAAVRGGADAVIAHGTHVMGPVEIYRGRPILYALGNFAFGSGNVFARFSLMAFLEVDPRRKRLTGLQLLPVYTVNRAPWVYFQTKVLTGIQARRTLRDLAARSRSYSAELELKENPARLFVPIP